MTSNVELLTSEDDNIGDVMIMGTFALCNSSIGEGGIGPHCSRDNRDAPFKNFPDFSMILIVECTLYCVVCEDMSGCLW